MKTAAKKRLEMAIMTLQRLGIRNKIVELEDKSDMFTPENGQRMFTRHGQVVVAEETVRRWSDIEPPQDIEQCRFPAPRSILVRHHHASPRPMDIFGQPGISERVYHPLWDTTGTCASRISSRYAL